MFQPLRSDTDYGDTTIPLAVRGHAQCLATRSEEDARVAASRYPSGSLHPNLTPLPCPRSRSANTVVTRRELRPGLAG